MSVLPFRFGVVTDELDDDLERAIVIARELGIDTVELNQLWGRNVVELADTEIARARRIITDAGMSVTAIDPPCFKLCSVDSLQRGRVLDDPEIVDHFRVLDRALLLAQRFSAPFVRVFAFRRSGMVDFGNPSPRLPEGGRIPAETLERVSEALGEAARRAEAVGITLALENVRSCWANTGVNTAKILAAVASPALQALWDPGNDFVSGGMPYPDGYEAVRPHVVHLHVKDARVIDASTGLTRWEAIGDGEIDYQGQLRALLEDDYEGVVSLETHWRPAVGSAESASRYSFAHLIDLVREAEDSASGGV
jgi:sugar phosphate isomerase/epimerase